MNIAIDGPAGAGKSTVAKMLAKELGFIYVDTGAMYRAAALYFLMNDIDVSDETAVARACELTDVSIRFRENEQQVLLNGDNVNGKIRREEVGNMASAISVFPVVRQKLTALQQKLAASEDVVMDGRDIGTCVLPNAEVKIYLTASVTARAKRRYQELLERGESCNLEEIQKDISDRDYRDMHRDASPLKQADDAVFVDSSELTLEETAEAVRTVCQEKLSCG
ncbi:MAG: (d)CMP kinase [Eubacterium sp.]|jgi:cytidylate kinase|nr:(d)CMP kinase [Eubacterium sp.]